MLKKETGNDKGDIMKDKKKKKQKSEEKLKKKKLALLTDEKIEKGDRKRRKRSSFREQRTWKEKNQQKWFRKVGHRRVSGRQRRWKRPLPL